MRKKGVLIIVPTYSPNVGGVETHLGDLVRELDSNDYRVYVHTYSPITTPGVNWEPREYFNNVEIRRHAWFGKNLLHKIEKKPVLVFLYIVPYLLIRVFLFMILNHRKIDIIHAHGFNAAFIGKFLKKIFRKKLFVSVHAIYELNPKCNTALFIRNILMSADGLSALSKASYDELVSFGIPPKKLRIHENWTDLERFRPIPNKSELKRRFNLPDRFSVICIARLTAIKGIKEFVSVAKKIPEISFIIVGNGPLENFVIRESQKIKNLYFMGSVDYSDLHLYYNLGDIFCIPSQYEEGYGRVAMEALACGSPVVGSNKGGIPEVVAQNVGILVDPSVENLTEAVSRLYKDRKLFQKLKQNCRSYAEKNFSSRNAEIILKGYDERENLRS